MEQGKAGKEDDSATLLDSEELKGLRLYVDLRKGDNAFSWVLRLVTVSGGCLPS